MAPKKDSYTVEIVLQYTHRILLSLLTSCQIHPGRRRCNVEQPVQIGLVFPRSGQQLFVTVPARAAEHTQTQYADRKTASANISSRAANESDTHA